MDFEADTIETAKGPLEIIPIHHATLVLSWNGETIYCDPVGDPARYRSLDTPTHIVLTHHHGDHFNLKTLEALAGTETELIAPRIVYEQLTLSLKDRTTLMSNGDTTMIGGFSLKATAMYNVTSDRRKFHEKGVGNGYLFDFGGTTVYLASDTEPVPEMEHLGSVDIAFFPMNLPYTMSADQVVECLKIVQPRIAYPFHYRFPFDAPGSDPSELIKLAKGKVNTEVRLRDWYRNI